MTQDWIDVTECRPRSRGLVLWWSEWEGVPEIAPGDRDPNAWRYTHWMPVPTGPDGRARQSLATVKPTSAEP